MLERKKAMGLGIGALLALSISVPSTADTSVPGHADKGGSYESKRQEMGAEADLIQHWKGVAAHDSVAAQALDDYLALTPSEQAEFRTLVEDPTVWEDILSFTSNGGTGDSFRTMGTAIEVRPGVTITSTTSIERSPSAHEPQAIYNVWSNYQEDVRLFGIKVGHFRQEYQYKTQTNQYEIVSSERCNGWWSGFSGYWNMNASTDHYKSGYYGYCITMHTGYLVVQQTNITMNKEQGQKVAGPSWVSRWLENK